MDNKVFHYKIKINHYNNVLIENKIWDN